MNYLNKKLTFKIYKSQLNLSLFIAISLFAFTSCNEDEKYNTKKSIEDLRQEICSLESKIELLETELEDQRNDNRDLFEAQRKDHWDLLDRIVTLEDDEVAKYHASFCISEDISDGYQVIETSSGTFLISIKEIKPYLSGYKIVFTIGNPSLATYENAKLKVSWNRSYKSWKEDKEYASKLAEYEKSFKEYLTKLKNKEANAKIPEALKRPTWFEERKDKEFTLLNPIAPGAWNSFEVHITPATLEQLEYVEVSLNTNTIKLTKDTH